ncbi:MAG: P-II family nitrogen regulator [Cyanobacteria bacterium]|nr:P-II family nitrogen regulator [Cyanobacteriota bacterium]
MREIKAIIRHDRVPEILDALHQISGLPGATLSVVQGFGRRIDTTAQPGGYGETELAKLELVVPSALTGEVVAAIQRAAHTGRHGDGKIFVIPVEDAVNVRTGAHGIDAL